MIIQVIQLAANEVTCARFRRNGKEPVPIGGFRLRWNNHDELGMILKEQCPLESEEVRTVLAIPPDLVMLREINLPITDPRKIRAVLPLELAGEIAAETSSLVCDAFPLANGNLLAGWLSRETVEPLIELLKEAGMEPEVVTVACFNWHYLLPAEDEQPTAIHDANAVLILKAGKPVYCRHLGTSAAALDQTLAAVELTHNLQVNRLYHLEHSDTEISARSEQIPVHPLLLGNISGDLAPAALSSPLAVALALCSGDTIFNLRSGPLAWTGRRSRLLRSIRIPLILAAILLLLLFTELGVRWYLLSTDLASLNQSIARIYKEVFPTRKKAVDESAELKAEIRRLEGAGASLPVLAFLKLLAEAKGDGITAISEMELDSNRFLLKGDARSSSDITAFRQRLIDKSWGVVQPELTTRPNGTVFFTMRGSREGGKP